MTKPVPHQSPIAYRPEIDGLRAVAILPVVFYHADFMGFDGGFVGVDVFFVISGYLIATIIIRDLIKGRFSILGFYERRARRILPALFFVILACLPVAVFLMFPSQLVEFGKSVLATVFFGSNILFWLDSGYFAAANELKPLLHTWSLALEEQFYLFFPLGMALLWRFGLRLKGLMLTVALMGLVSFILADWASTRMPAANFYLLPTRAWELASGVLTAFWLLRRPIAQGPWAEASSLLGLGLIGLAVVTLDGNYPWPGRWTLLPVLGTALIILCAHPSTLVGRWLSHPLIVFVGLISYSAYLWHQPLFAFARLGSPIALAPTVMVSLSLLTFILAWATWRFVESPFRNRAWLPRKQIFGWSVAGILGLAAAGSAGVLAQGMPWRFDAATLGLIAPQEQGRWFGTDCVAIPALPVGGCRYHPELPTRALIWGDSHAGALATNLAEDLAPRMVGLDVLMAPGCIPLPEIARLGKPTCDEEIPAQWAYVSSPAAPPVLILHSRWAMAFESTSFDNGEGGVERKQPYQLRLLSGGGRKMKNLSTNGWLTTCAPPCFS